MEEEDQGGASPAKEEQQMATLKRKRLPIPLVYASWSQGARKLDQEMQKKQETSDERRLASIVSGLGSYETSESDWQERPEIFVKGSRCLEKLKELQRCMNRENPDNRRIFLQLGQWNVVGKYIVPIILRYSEDTQLFLTALKVAILLTMPVETSSSNTFDQVEYLCQFKDEFCERSVIGAVVAHLEEPLEHMERSSVTEDDWRLLQLVLALVQNLLAVPEAMNWSGPYPAARYSQLRDKVLQCMFCESVPEIVLAIARNLRAFQAGIRRDNIVILQILHHMFWGQKAEELFRAAKAKEQSDAAPLNVNKDDNKGAQWKKFHRHSNFTGTYVRIDEDGSKTVLVKSPFQTREDKLEKHFQAGDRKEKSVARDLSIPLPSGEDVSVLLKEFADQFLSTGAYNTLMQTVKDDIRRERKDIENADIITFFRLAAFFTGYQHYQFSKNSVLAEDGAVLSQFCGVISCTMDDEMFKLVVSKWLGYVDYGKSPDWISIVSAGALLKEMIYILDAVLKNRSEGAERDVRIARTLSYKLFYDQTESGILNTASRSIKAFNIYKQPRSHLQTLVEITHVALKLIEGVTREDGALRVAKKARKKPKRKQNGKTIETEQEILVPNVEANGNQDQSTEEPVKLDGDPNPDDQDEAKIEHVNTSQPDRFPENDDEDEDEEDDSDRCPVHESTLDVQKCVEAFADIAVVSKYCWLLTHYDNNTLALNHYILCMLHRICKDCDLEPMLYQISILEIFHTIISDKKIAKLEEYKALVSFSTKVVRNFFKKLESCPLLYVDVLFAKSRKLCREISLDYTIRRESKGFGANRACLAEALGEDEGGSFGNMFPDAPSLCPSTQRDMEEVAPRTSPAKKRRRMIFSEEDETRIAELFQQFKEKRGCSKLIAEALNPDGKISAAQVTRKLKQLGLHRETAKRKPTEEHSGTSSDVDEEVNDDKINSSNSPELGRSRKRKLIKRSERDGARDISRLEEDDEVPEKELNKNKQESVGVLPPRKRKLIKRRDRIQDTEGKEEVLGGRDKEAVKEHYFNQRELELTVNSSLKLTDDSEPDLPLAAATEEERDEELNLEESIAPPKRRKLIKRADRSQEAEELEAEGDEEQLKANETNQQD